MRKRFEFGFGAGIATLVCLVIVCGCHGIEVPKYADLVKAWKPITTYHAAGDGSHIALVQSITNGVESGKYIWPQVSSFGPGGDGFNLTGWRGPTGTSLVDLGPKEGLGSVFDYTKPVAEGSTAKRNFNH